MLHKITFSIKTGSVTVFSQASLEPEAKGKVHNNTDWELEELKDPSINSTLWPCVLRLREVGNPLRFGARNLSRSWLFLQASRTCVAPRKAQRSPPSSLPQPQKV